MTRITMVSDFLNLKTRVKAEMARRDGNGSMTAYAGSAYDYSQPAADGKPVYKEHIQKNLDPLRAVQPAGLPGEATLKQADYEAMETRITANELIPRNNRGANDCAGLCSGMCVSQCTTECTSCTGTCTGCSTTCSGGCKGCSGCGGGCSDSCSGCDGGCGNCSPGCSSSCTTYCYGGNIG